MTGYALSEDDKKELKRRLYELISVQREKDAEAGKGRFRA